MHQWLKDAVYFQTIYLNGGINEQNGQFKFTCTNCIHKTCQNIYVKGDIDISSFHKFHY